MNTFLKIAAPIGILGVGVLGVIALNITKPEPEKVKEEVRSLSVFVENVRQEPVTLTVTTQGEVRPKTEITLIPQVSGQIIHVSDSFVEGGFFRKGEVLIKIEDTDYLAAVSQAEAQVAGAKLELARQEASASIVAKQWKWDKLEEEEPTELGLRRPQVAEARARLRAAEADLKSAHLNLARTEIKAPFNGHVRTKNTDIGAVIAPGAELGRIFATGRVEIRLPLTDSQLGQLSLPVAFNASANTPALPVKLSAKQGGVVREWDGKIVRTDAAIDQSTRLYFAIAEVEDPYGAAATHGAPLAVGLFVNAEISGQTIDNAYTIPRSALRPNAKVYVVTAEETLDIRDVQVLSSDASRAVIAHGLEAGEQVVISNISTPKQGISVTAAKRDEAARLATLEGASAGGGL